MRNLPRRIPHNINNHRHPRRQMPQNMTMEKPHSRIFSPEAQHRVPSARDLDCIAEGGAGEIVGLVRWVCWGWWICFWGGFGVWF